MTASALNAFVTAADTPVASAPDGQLNGKTLAVKDIFDVAGYRSGWGNPQKLAETQPAKVTAPSVQALFDAGAKFIGKTQTDELAFSLTGHNAHYPQPINPQAPNRVTGGSSSGSAAAVSGELADIATGTDTGGSIRAPASFCGLVGLRTSHGRISLDGTMPLAPSFDTYGWFAADAALYETVGSILLGDDEDDTQLAKAICWDRLHDFVDVDASESLATSMSMASEVIGRPERIDITNHHLDDLYWCFRKLQSAEAWECHRDWITSSDRGLGPGVKERFEFGSQVGAETVAEETNRRDAFRTELAGILGRDGVLIMPTVPGPAPLRDSVFADQQAFRERALRLLCLSGLSGFPQITIPLAEIDGAPFGISLLGPAGRDLALIRLANDIMEASGRNS